MIEIKRSENGFFEILVKPNAKETKIVSFDEKKNIYHMEVSAPPTEGKANTEIVKFFKRTYKLNVEIKSGKASHKKLIRVN